MITVFLTDDQTLFLDSLGLYLQGDPEVEVIGSSVTGRDTISAVRKKQPRLLLLDLKLPDMPGLEVAEVLKNEFPEMKIIILTSFENENDMLSVVACGIDGYIIKDISPEQLILVIKTIDAGFSVMHPGSYKSVSKAISKELCHFIEMNGCYDFSNFNLQEQRIIKLITEGKSNKEIASLLTYTEGTVKNYLSKILQKTGCRDRTHLAVQALKKDLA
ncbi:MAG: response regulator transcription factor [Spirochaetales bacterium]|nr:response regulator transcription factor [Spirochaetales bacterium]